MMTEQTPKRIQRKRTAGWRMPENTFYVGRPGDLGNPFPVDVYGQEGAVDRHRRWITGHMSTLEMSQSSTCHQGEISLVTLRQIVQRLICNLRGKNLACWCGPDQKCHADILLELANAHGESGETK